MKRRYFWVFFSGIEDDGSFREGRLEIHTKNGMFVNEIGAQKMIEKMFKLSQVHIKDVKEMTESDFMDFAAGRKKNGKDDDEPISFDFL